jgi:mannose-6-phosphate isomerase-like protein (cupin superfamily)
MADYTVKRLEDFESVFGGGFKRVRAGLGVTSFGLAVMEFPPDFHNYPEHTQEHDSQEEVYTVIAGRAVLYVEDERIDLEPGVWVRIGASERRRLETEGESARVVAIGGVPGGVYEAPDFTEEGAPDPMAKKGLRDSELGHEDFGLKPLT